VQVLVAQANFMRVLVDPTALSAEQREVIEHQVANARAAAAEAQLPCSVPEVRRNQSGPLEPPRNVRLRTLHNVSIEGSMESPY